MVNQFCNPQYGKESVLVSIRRRLARYGSDKTGIRCIERLLASARFIRTWLMFNSNLWN